VPVTTKTEAFPDLKEDGNSRREPTILWAQPLSDDGTALVGQMKELFRNDAPWEGALIEGPFVVRQDGWFYLFYSGSGCCGAGCNYAMGVARSKTLLGPWEKNPANPILRGTTIGSVPATAASFGTKKIVSGSSTTPTQPAALSIPGAKACWTRCSSEPMAGRRFMKAKARA